MGLPNWLIGLFDPASREFERVRETHRTPCFAVDPDIKERILGFRTPATSVPGYDTQSLRSSGTPAPDSR